MSSASLFLAYLAQFDDDAWRRAAERLEAAILPVDRIATRIWFHLYPMRLQRAMERADDPRALARRLVLEGQWRLADQVGTSHRFFYAHPYWPRVRDAVARLATGPHVPGSLDLSALTQETARAAAEASGVEPAVLTGLSAVAIRTLQQVGLDHFVGAALDAGAPVAPSRGPDETLAARVRDDSQGLLGFLRGPRRIWTITYDEHDPAARFPLVNSQHLTTAASAHRRPAQEADPRLSEGPIPVQCRSASCGTCWVGVLGGAEKLSPMEGRERQVLADCGYAANADDKPVIRLACMAQAHGAVSLVIPPWNGRLKNLPPGD